MTWRWAGVAAYGQLFLTGLLAGWAFAKVAVVWMARGVVAIRRRHALDLALGWFGALLHSTRHKVPVESFNYNTLEPRSN